MSRSLWTVLICRCRWIADEKPRGQKVHLCVIFEFTDEGRVGTIALKKAGVRTTPTASATQKAR